LITIIHHFKVFPPIQLGQHVVTHYQWQSTSFSSSYVPIGFLVVQDFLNHDAFVALLVFLENPQ